jgi:hypothetical protein
VLQATSVVATAALMSAGALTANAAAVDTSQASARFLSGTLLTSAGTLDALAALQGSLAANSGSGGTDTHTSSLDLTALGALEVQVPGGLDVPLLHFLKLGAVNQYAQASAAGVSRAGSGAVSDDGIVDVDGTGEFPANATIDLTDLLGSRADGVLDTATIELGAVTGVAAHDAAQGAPATSCSELSAPGNCLDYNMASAAINLHSPLVAQLVSQINGTLDTASTTVNGLSATLLGSVTSTVNDLIGALAGGDSDLNVTVDADLRGALASVLSGTVSSGGVALDLSSGAITVDLDAVIGGLNDRAPGTPLLSADVIDAVVDDLGTILTELQSTINTTLSTALNAVPVTISGGICMPLLGCNAPVGGTLSLSYDGTLADLAGGSAVISASGTGVVFGLLSPVVDLLTATLGTTLGGVVSPVLSSTLTTVGSAVGSATGTLTDTLDPVLAAIGTLIGIELNVQEPGATPGSYREVATRVSLLSGAVTTIDLGRAEVSAGTRQTASITALSPNHGPETGGTTVTITGSGLTDATGVTFGGVPGTGVQVTGDTSLSVKTPAHAPGAVDVVVTGSSAGDSNALTYTFDPATTIDTVDPAAGPETGGTTVTITGHCFTGATQVLFGDTPATSFVVNADGTVITAIAPAGTGVVDVTVVGSAACGSATDDDAFTYEPVVAPVVNAIDPDHGPEAGGTAVTITGSGFTGANAVTFGGVAASGVRVVDDGTITASTPAHPVGAVDVVVRSPQAASTPVTYTYDPGAVIPGAPTVAGLVPDHGPETGGTLVTITGTGFDDSATVDFGGAAATRVEVSSATQLTAVTPAHPVGVVAATVTTDAGTSGPALYAFDPVTTIDGVDPSSGPETGGTVVTITGHCFADAADVVFGGTSASEFIVNADGTVITAIAPAGVGVVDVTVVGSAACGSATDDDAYSYVPAAAPVITSIQPDRGPEAGGTVVTILGTGFARANAASFDGAAGTAFQVDSDTQITVTTPAHRAATVDVVVTAPSGESNAGTFTYYAAGGNGGDGDGGPGGGNGGSAGDGGSAAEGLAKTGSTIAVGSIATAVALLVGGLALVVIRRRRSA